LPTCNFRFSYHFSEKETRLQEQRWAVEDQINDLQKQTNDSTTIADQLKEFVQNFPQLQAGERTLSSTVVGNHAPPHKTKLVMVNARLSG